MDTGTARLKESRFDFVHDSQKTFRTLLSALASPGKIHAMPPVSLSIESLAIGFILQPFLTLLDLETSFYVHAEDSEIQEEAARYLEINTNSVRRECDQADFILCLEPSLGGRFGSLKKGSLTQPHASATVFYLVDGLFLASNNGAAELVLSGPGIEGQVRIYVSGIGAEEMKDWDGNRRDYPLGIDIYFISRTGEIAGLPRSAVIAR